MPDPKIGEDVTHLMAGTQPQTGEDVTDLMNGASSSEPSFLEKLGGWRGVAGGAIRAGSGILSAEGGLLGAGVSGLGEGLAELAEGSDFSPTKIGVEAGFGAVPFGKIVKGGKIIASAARSGALGAAHSGVSDVVGNYQAGKTGTDLLPSASSVGLGGGLGALLGGAGAAWMGRGAAAAAKPTMVDIETTTRTGPHTMTLGPKGKGAVTPSQPRSIPMKGTLYEPPSVSELAGLGDVDPQRIPYAGSEPAPYRASARQPNPDDVLKARLEDQFGRANDKAEASFLDRLAEEEANEQAEANIQRTIVDAGLKKQAPTVTVGESAVDSQGRTLQSRQTYAQPHVDDDENQVVQAAVGRVLGAKPEMGATGPNRGLPGEASGADELGAFQDWLYGGDAPTIPNGKPPVQTDLGSMFSGRPALDPMAHLPPVPEGRVKAPRGRSSASKVEKFQSSVDDILGAAPELSAELPAAATVPDDAPQTVGFFKSPVDAAGANYRAAKAAEGENPLARRQAGVALNAEAARAGLPTKGPTDLGKFLSSRVEPELGGAAPAPAPKAPRLFNKGGGASQRGHNFLDDLRASAGEQAPAAPAAASTEQLNAQDIQALSGIADPADRRAAIQRLIEEQGGGISQAVLAKLGSAASGALIGAPIGAAANPDDPYAALKGGLTGGALGFAGANGAMKAMEAGRGAAGGALKELTQMRNAGLLSGIAQIKKPLSDIGAIVGKGAEDTLTPGRMGQGLDILKELFRVPTNARNYGAAMKNPELAGEVIGDALKSNAPTDQGLLGWVGRPFGAAQYASQQILERAGVSPEEARKILYLGNPSDTGGATGAASQAYLNLQDPQMLSRLVSHTPGVTPEAAQAAGRNASQFVRAVRPFARISSNLFAHGVQTIPGVSLMTGDPETRMARTLLGSGALAAGAATGASDVADQEAGAEPPSAAIRGLRRAALAKYSLPFIMGEAMFGPRGARDLYYAVPGMNALLEPPGPKDTVFSYGGKQVRNWLKQLLPGVMEPNQDKPGR